MSENTYDMIVIGGGPAGYVGAIRAAQLGMKTACVERDLLGGVCLNWGCIPTKALLAGAEFYSRLKNEASEWGILADNVRHDWSKVIARSRGVAGTLNRGIGSLFKKNKVAHIAGSAKIVAAGKVEVTDKDGKTETLTCKHIVIATGAGPRALPGAGFDGERIINYKEAMSLPAQPKELIVIGAGPIGMEFAYFYNAFGTKVTVIEMLDNVLPNEDQDVSKVVARSFKKQGVECMTSTKTLAVRKTSGGGVEVDIAPVSDESKKTTLKADKVLVAIGVAGKFDGLFDEKQLPIAIEKHHIKVDKSNYQTSVKGVYAVGDVIGPPWLAHVASEEAIVCVEKIAGLHTHPVDYSSIPGCTYCLPQVASLGMTEQMCKAQGLQPGVGYKVGKFPFQASGKAQALGSTEGFIKIISDPKHGEILGVHMVGESVTELLAEMGLAKRLEATTDELIATMHAHPTLSEAVHEAALGAEGRMIHA
ncbi:MAG: dihydrolipoyl dehydrogenase [Phycisphaera sp.]|nr:dihydrolipoyl dehydrogenase [Phycisphaera sp.]